MKQLPRPCIGNGARPCRYRALAPQGSRCPRCQTEYQNTLGKTTLRGYGHTWQTRTRPEILERDRYICHWCGRYGDTVDHVVLKVDGGSDDPSNLVAACGACNSRRNQHCDRPANSESPQQRRRGPQQTR